MKRSLDRVRASAGAGDVNRHALDLETEPDHADLGAHQSAVCRLRDQAGVGAIAALQRRERAHSGAFFLDHRLQMDAALRGQSRRLQRIQCVERCDGAGLHVAGAAAIEPAVLDGGLERRMLPHVQRAGGHDVAMALQDQRAPGFLCGPIGADHGAGAREIGFDRTVAGQVLEIVLLDHPVVDLVAALAQQPRHHVLTRRFLAAGARDRRERDRRRQLRLEGGIDRGLDALAGAGGEGDDVALRHGSVLGRFCSESAIGGTFRDYAERLHHASTSCCRAKLGCSKKRRPGIASSRSRV